MLKCSTKFDPMITIPKIDKIGTRSIVSFDTSWIRGVTNPKKTVAPRKIRIASSFFRYFPRAINPWALIVYRQLEMKVTKMPVSTKELSSKSQSAMGTGIGVFFLNVMQPSNEH